MARVLQKNATNCIITMAVELVLGLTTRRGAVHCTSSGAELHREKGNGGQRGVVLMNSHRRWPYCTPLLAVLHARMCHPSLPMGMEQLRVWWGPSPSARRCGWGDGGWDGYVARRLADPARQGRGYSALPPKSALLALAGRTARHTSSGAPAASGDAGGSGSGGLAAGNHFSKDGRTLCVLEQRRRARMVPAWEEEAELRPHQGAMAAGSGG